MAEYSKSSGPGELTAKPTVNESSGSSECAICYVTDLNFLHPTLVSARSVRLRTAVSPDIYIFMLGVPDSVAEATQNLCSDFHLVKLETEVLTGFNSAKFARTHVPMTTLGRFFIADYLPKGYGRILYIDGDTWAVRSLDELIAIEPPPGMLAAADDPLSFFVRNWSRAGYDAREYLRALGLDASEGYFNAGVMLSQLPAWRAFMEEGWRYFQGNTGRCLYHDQSALNVAASGRRLRLSSKWNFCSPYRLWDVEDYVHPHLYHFVGGVKPWMGRCAPWADIHDGYMSEWEYFAPLHLPAKKLCEEDLRRFNSQAVLTERRLRTVHALRGLRYRRQMRRVAKSDNGAPGRAVPIFGLSRRE